MNLTMTFEERFWGLVLQVIIVLLIVMVAYGIFEAMAERIEHKRELERRACKRYNAPIRPGRRY